MLDMNGQKNGVLNVFLAPLSIEADRQLAQMKFDYVFTIDKFWGLNQDKNASLYCTSFNQVDHFSLIKQVLIRATLPHFLIMLRSRKVIFRSTYTHMFSMKRGELVQ